MAVPHLNKTIRHKEYQPKFLELEESVPLPPVDSFKLDHILNKTLYTETHDVVNQLTNVFSNYQDDLRLELKLKLLIEQKIQYKNIQLGKLINRLNNHVLQKKKKVKKLVEEDGVNVLDSEVGQLVEAASTTASLLRNLTDRVGKLSSLNEVSYEKYPNLFRVVHKKEWENKKTETAQGGDRRLGSGTASRYSPSGNLDSVITASGNPDAARPASAKPDSRSASAKSSVITRSAVNGSVLTTMASAVSAAPKSATTINDTMQTKSADTPDLQSSELNSAESNETYEFNPILSTPIKGASNVPGYLSDELMTSDQFELFMSASISKYRQIQSTKYDDTDPFNPIDSSPIGNSSFATIENNAFTPMGDGFSTSSIKLPEFKNNPINLLYSSLLSNPNYVDSTPIQKPTLPFPSLLSVKSSPTTMLDHQISHFKKLRINGSPITSESFLKHPQAACACADGVHSPAHKALEDTLLHSDLKLGSDDDTWNSSGLNTDIEEEPNGSSDSSDSDSLNSTDNNINVTNEYYSSFNQKLKQKKKKRMSQHEARFQAELSPTPKHKPSHHTLKPKGSILKTQLGKARAQPTTLTAIVQSTSDDSHSNERTGISALNQAYESSSNYQISNFTVQGSILSTKQEEDEGSDYEDQMHEWSGSLSPTPEDTVKSIFMLKSLIRQ